MVKIISKAKIPALVQSGVLPERMMAYATESEHDSVETKIVSALTAISSKLDGLKPADNSAEVAQAINAMSEMIAEFGKIVLALTAELKKEKPAVQAKDEVLQIKVTGRDSRGLLETATVKVTK